MCRKNLLFFQIEYINPRIRQLFVQMDQFESVQKSQNLYRDCYIQLYNMKQTTILHSPTLESVIMVEKTIQKHSQECGKYQLWKRLPKKMMYQTFKVILAYLEQSGKIMIDKDGCIIWTFDPKGIKEILAKGVRLY